MAVGALIAGLIGSTLYQSFRHLQRRTEQRRAELVNYADSVQAAMRRERASGRMQPPEDSAYELSAVESAPELLNREEVSAALTRFYPPLLRDAGVTGSVTLRMRIGRDGQVDHETVEIIASTHQAFNDAARRVVWTLRFRPARHKGEPVPVWVTLPVNFELARA